MKPSESPAPGTFHNDKGLALSTLMSGATIWENSIIPIGPAARRLAWACLGSTSAAAFAGQLWIGNFPQQRPDLYLGGFSIARRLVDTAPASLVGLAGAAVVLGLLALLTGGFRQAGRRVQIALAAALVGAGLSLIVPFGLAAITVLNVIAWAAFFALCMVVGAVVVLILVS